MDFTRPPSGDLKTTMNSVSLSSSTCSQNVEYVYIKEEKRTKSVTICGGSKRQKHIYLSVGYSVQLTVSTQLHRKNKGHFVLQYNGELIDCRIVINFRILNCSLRQCNDWLSVRMQLFCYIFYPISLLCFVILGRIFDSVVVCIYGGRGWLEAIQTHTFSA